MISYHCSKAWDQGLYIGMLGAAGVGEETFVQVTARYLMLWSLLAQAIE